MTGIGLNVNFTEEDMSEDVKYCDSIKIEKATQLPDPFAFAYPSQLLVLRTGSKKLTARKTPFSYRKQCDTIGRDIRVTQDEDKFTGTAVGINRQEHLS